MGFFRALQIELTHGLEDCYDENWGGNARDPIRDDFSRIYMLKSGRAEVILADGRTVNLEPGFIYLFPCGQTAYYRCTEPMRLRWVHFRLEYLPGLDVFTRFDPPRQAPRNRQSDRDFKALLKGVDAVSPDVFAHAVRALLGLLAPFLPTDWQVLGGGEPLVERLRPAIDFIRADPTRNLTLKRIAATVHLHPTYFSNLFRETLGITPMQFMTGLRIRQARTMLLSTEKTVAEISLACGYDDQFYFTRVFKKNTGQSPRQFRLSSGIFDNRSAAIKWISGTKP